MITFGSVCSGIEAASVAWGPLGWRAEWFSEIEPFPSAVLAHHYPEVPNLGDMTTIARRVLTGEVEAPDLLCGGTPCQAFSVAGLRNSLDDERGNLTLKFVELADAIDHVRGLHGKPPTIVFWENVPGVLSTKDNAFGCFLAGLAGEDEPLLPPGQDPAKPISWTSAGCVFGPQRAIAWRTLDAQYFGVAQRRRRVFVVASARNGFDPAQVLFEWDGVRRDSAPGREAGKVAPTIPSRSTAGGGLGTDFDCDGGLIQAYGGNNQSGPIEVATARNACASASGRMDFETETFLVQPAHTLRGEGFDASEDGSGRGTPLVPVHRDLAPTLTSNYGKQPDSSDTSAGPMLVPVGVTIHGTDPTVRKVASYDNLAQCLRARTPGNIDNSSTTVVQQPVAVALRGREGGATAELGDEVQNCLRASSGGGDKPHVLAAMQVRRLTPRECEALQGFPQDYTAIPWRKKPAGECPDGPRYKALGNSWAVPVVRWIGHRISRQIELTQAKEAA